MSPVPQQYGVALTQWRDPCRYVPAVLLVRATIGTSRCAHGKQVWDDNALHLLTHAQAREELLVAGKIMGALAAVSALHLMTHA